MVDILFIAHIKYVHIPLETHITYEDQANGILYGRSKFCQKVKNLVWRACRDYFPTCVRLIIRGVTCPAESVICSETIEDTMHAIFTFSQVTTDTLVF